MAVKKLNDMMPGEKGVIISVGCDREIRKRLLDMGFVRGAVLKIVRSAPLDDPLEVEIKGYNLSIRRRDSDKIELEV